MNEENKEAIFTILREHAEQNAEHIDAATSLEALGIDSLGLVEIIFDLEERFDVSIPDPTEVQGSGSDFKTAGDVITAVSRLIEDNA